MTKKTNRDKNLEVNVTLYNNCAAFGDVSALGSKNITYLLNTTEIFIEGYEI